MSYTILVSFAAVSLLLVAALELLWRRQRTTGGLLFAPSVKEFTVWQNIVALYLPVVIVTIYGIVWTWIEITSKRLEPFFQLSKPGGASARETLTLDYPTDFIAWLPIKALRHRSLKRSISSNSVRLTCPIGTGLFSSLVSACSSLHGASRH